MSCSQTMTKSCAYSSHDWKWALHAGCSERTSKKKNGRSDFREITKVSESRDLWPRPWPWAHPGCGLLWDHRVQVWWLSSHLPARRSDFREITSVAITWYLTLTRLTLTLRAYENQRTDGDVKRHCRLMSRSECTTLDMMLFQYQLICADATKMEHYSISAD